MLVTMNELILVQQNAFENMSIIGQGMKYLVTIPDDIISDR